MCFGSIVMPDKVFSDKRAITPNDSKPPTPNIQNIPARARAALVSQAPASQQTVADLLGQESPRAGVLI